jgi:hypothetical protein
MVPGGGIIMRSWVARLVVVIAFTVGGVSNALPKDPGGWQYRGYYCDHSEHEKWNIFENDEGEMIQIYGGSC